MKQNNQSQNESEANPAARSKNVWLSRAVTFAMIAVALWFAWPSLKGFVYTVFPPEPASKDELPQWRESYEAALAESKESGKPVLIDFSAVWCPPCKVMEADVWPNQRVRDALEAHVVPLQLDVDEPTSAAVSRKYGIQAIPTILLVDSEGTEIARGNFMNARVVVDFVSRHAR